MTRSLLVAAVLSAGIVLQLSVVPIPSFRADVRRPCGWGYQGFNQPKDDMISGSGELSRSSEVQVTQMSVGGDSHYNNVRARLMTQFGMYSFTTPLNDARSPTTSAAGLR